MASKVGDTCIVYYGRTLASGSDNNKTHVGGVYNSILFRSGFDSQEEIAKHLVHAGPEDFEKLRQSIKNGSTDSIGPWNMYISHHGNIPKQFIHTPVIDTTHFVGPRKAVKLREPAWFDF